MLYKFEGILKGERVVKYGFSTNIASRLSDMSLILDCITISKVFDDHTIDWKSLEKELHLGFEGKHFDTNISFEGYTEVYRKDKEKFIDRYLYDLIDSDKFNITSLVGQYNKVQTVKVNRRLMYSKKWVDDGGVSHNLNSSLKLIYSHRFNQYDYFYNTLRKPYYEKPETIASKLGINLDMVLKCENLLHSMGLLYLNKKEYTIQPIGSLKGRLL